MIDCMNQITHQLKQYDMKQETLFIAVATQKGGVGKTALTVLLSSYLHYVRGYNVAVVDCDYPQFSINGMRERDKKMVTEDPYYKNLFYKQSKELNKKAYPIEVSRASDSLGIAKTMVEESQTPLDFVFFDLPGTINAKGVLTTLSQMDYVFTPITADRMVLESSLEYAALINEQVITTGKGKIKALNLFWNLVDAREHGHLYDVYENVIDELGLQVMKTYLPDSKRFRHEITTEHRPIFRSTLMPIDNKLLQGSNIEEFVDEFLKIIKEG